MQASKYVGACTQIILLIDFKGGAKYNSTTQGYSSDPSISAVTEYDALDELLQQYQSKATPAVPASRWSTSCCLATVGIVLLLLSMAAPPASFALLIVMQEPEKLVTVRLEHAWECDAYHCRP